MSRCSSGRWLVSSYSSTLVVVALSVWDRCSSACSSFCEGINSINSIDSINIINSSNSSSNGGVGGFSALQASSSTSSRYSDRERINGGVVTNGGSSGAKNSYYKYAVIGRGLSSRSSTLSDNDICSLLLSMDPESNGQKNKAVLIDTRDYNHANGNAVNNTSFFSDSDYSGKDVYVDNQIVPVSDIDYRAAGVASFDVHNNRLTLTDGAIVHYEKCLINLGSRPTVVSADTYFDKDCMNYRDRVIDATDPNCYSILEKAVLSGKHVTILGSDHWDCIELATSLTETILLQRALRSIKSKDKSKSSSSSSTSSSSSSLSSMAAQGSITMLTSGGPSILSSALPLPLAKSALNRLKRISYNIIEHCPYSQIRFISAISKNKVKDEGYFSVLMGSTYDNLSTSSFNTDYIVYHPSSSSLPEFDDKSNKNRNNLLTTWRSINNAGLETEERTKALVVNRSLQACEGVYVIGESANIYNSRLGRLVHNGHANLHAMCHRAVRNMTRNSSNGPSSSSAAVVSSESFNSGSSRDNIYDHIPVASYSSRLLGANFLFVGACSTLYETVGYYWKVDGLNSQFPQSTFADIDSSSGVSGSSNRLSAKGSKSNSNNNSESSHLQNLGVTFYIDNRADGEHIKGVLVTGLPPPPPQLAAASASNGEVDEGEDEAGSSSSSRGNGGKNINKEKLAGLNYYNVTSYASSQIVGTKLSDLHNAKHLLFEDQNSTSAAAATAVADTITNVSESQKYAILSRLASAIISPSLNQQSLNVHKEAILSSSLSSTVVSTHPSLNPSPTSISLNRHSSILLEHHHNNNNRHNYNNSYNNSNYNNSSSSSNNNSNNQATGNFIVLPSTSSSFISGLKTPKVIVTAAVIPDKESNKVSMMKAIGAAASIPAEWIASNRSTRKPQPRSPACTPDFAADFKLFKEY